MSGEALFDGMHAGEARVFDDSFNLESFYAPQGLLQAAEISIHRDGHSYMLSVLTPSAYTERLALEGPVPEGEDLDEDKKGGPCVIQGDEILPEVLLSIKNAPTEELLPFLVEQVTE